MKKFVLAAAVLSVLSVAPVRSQTTPTTYVLLTVDAVSVNGPKLLVTGVDQATGTSITVTLNYYGTGDAAAWQGQANACQRQALLAMTKPGLHLELQLPAYSGFPPVCKLVRPSP